MVLLIRDEEGNTENCPKLNCTNEIGLNLLVNLILERRCSRLRKVFRQNKEGVFIMITSFIP